MFSKTMKPRDIDLPIQDAFLHFVNKLQEPMEVLEQRIVVSSAIDQLREKQHLFETFESDVVKKLQNPQHWFL